MGAGDRFIDLVVGYWRNSLAYSMTVLHIDKKGIWVNIGGVKIVGVYRNRDEGTKDIQKWVAVKEEIARIGKRLGVGDWNSSHPKWSLNRARDARGTPLQEGMT